MTRVVSVLSAVAAGVAAGLASTVLVVAGAGSAGAVAEAGDHVHKCVDCW
jgi:hypothetical protein